MENDSDYYDDLRKRYNVIIKQAEKAGANLLGNRLIMLAKFIAMSIMKVTFDDGALQK